MLDLEAAISPRVQALAVTKVDSADHIRLVAEVVSELEAERGMAVGATQFIAMIETPSAWFRMPEIAKADRRIVALTLGGEDFALSVGMLPTAEALFMPKQQLAIAARAAGILPLGFIGTVADYKDLDAFRADRAALAPARLPRRLGDPSGADPDPQRGVRARAPTRSRRRERSSRPTTRRSRPGAARFRSTAR